MNKHRRFMASVGVVFTLVMHPLFAAEHREHGPHVHGVGQLNVALDGTALEIELDSPAANVVGFEHPPRDAAEQAQKEQAIAQLRDGASLFLLPKAAGCRLEEAKAAEEATEHHADEEDHHGDGEEEHHHTDINVSYRFHCDRPEALTDMDVRLFERFPATHKLEVQLIGPHGQSGGELTATDHHLSL
jgi:hypothetical protein